MLLLLSFAVDHAPYRFAVRFKVKDTPLEKRDLNTMARVRLQRLSIHDNTIYLPLCKFDFSMKRREITPRDNNHGKMLKSEKGIF